MQDRCAAWGCKEKAKSYIPDPSPRLLHAYYQGAGVPWYPSCGKYMEWSASGKTLVHPK